MVDWVEGGGGAVKESGVRNQYSVIRSDQDSGTGTGVRTQGASMRQERCPSRGAQTPVWAPVPCGDRTRKQSFAEGVPKQEFGNEGRDS